METASGEQEETIKLPQIRTAKDKTVAEIAVHVLSREWPLPLKSLQWKVNREHGKGVTFQATHKALKKLVKEGILVKKNKYYELNQKWLDQIVEFGTQTRQAYSKGKSDGLKKKKINRSID